MLGDIVRAGGEGVVVLEHVYRYGAGIDRLAAAIRTGDEDAVIEPGKRVHVMEIRGATALVSEE